MDLIRYLVEKTQADVDLIIPVSFVYNFSALFNNNNNINIKPENWFIRHVVISTTSSAISPAL